MVGEVTLTDSEQARDRGLQLVVNPDTAHCIVDGREYHHWLIVLEAVLLAYELAWVNVGNLLVHVKEVAVTLADLVDAEALDRLREVKEYSQTGVVYTKALVATLLGST